LKEAISAFAWERGDSPAWRTPSSKKWENHWAAVACWFAFYNFCRIHKSLRVTPAMAAGIADNAWTVRELLEAA
jgi:hypothetical protein